MCAIDASDNSDDDRSLAAFVDGYDTDDSIADRPHSAHSVRFSRVKEVRVFSTPTVEEVPSANSVTFTDIDLGPFVPTALPAENR